MLLDRGSAYGRSSGLPAARVPPSDRIAVRIGSDARRVHPSREAFAPADVSPFLVRLPRRRRKHFLIFGLAQRGALHFYWFVKKIM